MLLDLPDDILETILKEMEYRELVKTMVIHPRICEIAKKIQHERRTRLLGLLLETDGVFRIEFSYTVMSQDNYINEPTLTIHNDGVFIFVEYNSPDIPLTEAPNKIVIHKQDSNFAYLVYRPEFIQTLFHALENYHLWNFAQEEGQQVIRKYFSISDYSENQYKKRALTDFLEMNDIKVDYTIYQR